MKLGPFDLRLPSTRIAPGAVLSFLRAPLGRQRSAAPDDIDRSVQRAPFLPSGPSQAPVRSVFETGSHAPAVELRELLLHSRVLVAHELGPDGLAAFERLPEADLAAPMDRRRTVARLLQQVQSRIASGGPATAFEGLEHLDVQTLVHGRLGRNGAEWFAHLAPIVKDGVVRALLKAPRGQRADFAPVPRSPAEWVQRAGMDVPHPVDPEHPTEAIVEKAKQACLAQFVSCATASRYPLALEGPWRELERLVPGLVDDAGFEAAQSIVKAGPGTTREQWFDHALGRTTEAHLQNLLVMLAVHRGLDGAWFPILDVAAGHHNVDAVLRLHREVFDAVTIEETMSFPFAGFRDASGRSATAPSMKRADAECLKRHLEITLGDFARAYDRVEGIEGKVRKIVARMDGFLAGSDPGSHVPALRAMVARDVPLRCAERTAMDRLLDAFEAEQARAQRGSA